MVDYYQQGLLFEGKSETFFLDFLFKMMNPSVEQLRNTYLSTSSESYKELAREMTTLLELEENN